MRSEQKWEKRVRREQLFKASLRIVEKEVWNWGAYEADKILKLVLKTLKIINKNPTFTNVSSINNIFRWRGK